MTPRRGAGAIDILVSALTACVGQPPAELDHSLEEHEGHIAAAPGDAWWPAGRADSPSATHLASGGTRADAMPAADVSAMGSDLEGAMAAFIVGNYMVFANREVQDGEFAAVAEQLRQGGGTRRLAETQSAETIRNLYEKSAMVGAFMALAYNSQQQKAQPEQVAANLRNSARENLKLVLGADPERLQIDERGVMLVK